MHVGRPVCRRVMWRRMSAAQGEQRGAGGARAGCAPAPASAAARRSRAAAAAAAATRARSFPAAAPRSCRSSSR
jgi:hypothetical protein